MVKPLELRVTHKYVGSYQHEDEWKEVGAYVVTYTEKWKLEETDEFDPTEPLKHVYHVQVDSHDDATVEEVSRALQDSFTKVGCHHEYDCCGCRSFYAKKPTSISDNNSVWLVEVNSFRNY